MLRRPTPQIIMRVVNQKLKLQWEAGAAPAYRKLSERCMAHDLVRVRVGHFYFLFGL